MTTPDPQRDLELIDAALRGGHASSSDPRERELEELALVLAHDVPRPDPGFARELDRRVAEGFPRARPRLRLAAVRLRWVPAMVAVAGFVLAALVVAGLLGGDDSAVVGGGAGTQALVSPRPPAQEPQLPAAAADAPLRQPERSARLTLAVAPGELQQTADAVARVAAGHNGYVAFARSFTGGGTLVLRIPAKEFGVATAELAALGDLRGRSRSAHDMAAPFRGTAGRLARARRARRATAARLRTATGATRDRLRARLRALDAEIADLSGRMDDLRRRAVFSTVTVTLTTRAR